MYLRSLGIPRIEKGTFIQMADEKLVDNKTADLFPEESLKEVVEAGVFFGRKKSKVNPKMRPYILANRGGIEIINLHKTLEKLTKATEFVQETIKKGGLALLVGTEPSAIDINDLAKEFNFPVVSNRWLGGTLTNFKIILQRVNYFKKLKTDMKAGAFEKYTKKERVGIESEIRRLEELVGGLENLTRLPDFVLIIDPKIHMTAVREANRMKIPVVTFSNVDADPDVLEYFVPGNTKARKSVNWFFAKVKKAIEDGKVAQPAAAAVKTEKAASTMEIR